MSGRSDHDLLSSHGLISQYKQELGLPEPEAQAGHARGSVALDWRRMLWVTSVIPADRLCFP